MNYERELNQLRNKLVRDQMSVMVGAGFSMNVHPNFLSWAGLLFDLVKELYIDEIEQIWHLKNREAPVSEMPDKFVMDQCRKITDRIGHLEIVEEYTRRKGYPEAMVSYIEQRTPAIEKKGNKFFLHIKNKEIELPSEKLALHQKLIKLPWNNIYTTNYDELLDCFVGEDQVAQLRQEILELENENVVYYQEKAGLSDRLANLPNTPETNQPTPGLQPVGLKATALDVDEVSKINEQRKEIETLISEVETKITDNEQALRDKETLLLRRYDVVRGAADLRLKRTKNIIKLHGSLRSVSDRKTFKFGFDGDPHKQYIISRSHFENYPQQHQAFTQLMRIALLQESFCLIGFSGQDPNFKAWLNWVKDILHKQAVKNDRNNYKVYLIDVGADEITDELRLFYENHSIVRIPLQHKEVKKFLNQQLEGANKINNEWSALMAFILFLENADHNNFDIPQIQLPLEETRKKYWANLGVFGLREQPDLKKAGATLENLQKIDQQIWFPNFDHAHTYVQDRFIRHAKLDEHMSQWQENDPDHPLKRLLLKAITELYIPVNDALYPQVRQIIADSPVAGQLEKLSMRNLALMGQPGETQTTHDRLLAAAYSFNFVELQKLLSNWDVVGRDQITKLDFQLYLMQVVRLKNFGRYWRKVAE
ncbi:hypothetical protein A0256_15470 [Mucilaginibacter sp. PAMC 26640]|nr:hypothetical protein A0256_15470 [Mucilaginibacter sp. PAMC 26640]